MTYKQCDKCYKAIMAGKLVVRDGMAESLIVAIHICDNVGECRCVGPHIASPGGE